MAYQGYQQFNGYPVRHPQELTTITRETIYASVNVKACNWSGRTQIVLGFLAIVFGSVAIAIQCHEAEIAIPVWSGFWFLLSGVIGCWAAKRVGQRAYSLLVWYVLLNAFSILCSINIVTNLAISVTNEPPFLDNHMSSKNARVAIDSVLIAVGCLEIVAANVGLVVAFKTIGATKTKSIITSRPVVHSYTALPNACPVSPCETNYAFQPPKYTEANSEDPIPKTPPPSYGAVGGPDLDVGSVSKPSP